MRRQSYRNENPSRHSQRSSYDGRSHHPKTSIACWSAIWALSQKARNWWKRKSHVEDGRISSGYQFVSCQCHWGGKIIIFIAYLANNKTFEYSVWFVQSKLSMWFYPEIPHMFFQLVFFRPHPPFKGLICECGCNANLRETADMIF